MGPMAVGENGKSAMLEDPGGAMLGAWQPGTQKGFEVTGEPGTPSWFELHTRDYAKSVDFYRDVFGWDTHVAGDTDELRYTTLGEGETSSPGSWTTRCIRRPTLPTGRSTSGSTTPTLRSRRSSSSGAA